jgi:hypothetical protein
MDHSISKLGLSMLLLANLCVLSPIFTEEPVAYSNADEQQQERQDQRGDRQENRQDQRGDRQQNRQGQRQGRQQGRGR